MRRIVTGKPPTNQTKVRCLLGLCNVLHGFVEGFARIASPLNRELEKDQPFELETLTDEEFEACDELHQCLILPPILALPRNGHRHVIYTDAGNTPLMLSSPRATFA